MYRTTLKDLLSNIKDPNGDCSPRSRKPKHTKVRFADSGGELEMLSLYTDGRDIWVDLQRPTKRKS